MNVAKILLFLLPLLLLHPAKAQSRKELEEKKRKAQEEIALTRKVLEETQKKKKQTLNNLVLLGKLIRNQNDLIETIREEISSVDEEIAMKSNLIEELEFALDQEKSRLARVMIQSYKSRSKFSRLAFIFSSESFNQAVSRIKYIRKLASFQKKLISDIRDRKLEVNARLLELEGVKTKKSSLLGAEEIERRQLERDRQSKDELAKSLGGKERDLRKKLNAQQQALKRLDQAIRNLIAKEMEAQRKSAAAPARNTAPKSTGGSSGTTSKTSSSAPAASLTPESRALSSAFATNKGKLPWPLERGVITQGFGTYQHPELRDVTLVSNGIDISSVSGAQARAVFKGVVSAVLSIPGQEQAVLVNHGEYFTVYANLGKVLVKKGDQIDTRQPVGVVFTDEDGKTELQFQVWQGQKVQNPVFWLLAR
jgi:septal ring factor EnvC (AmiA/AmiB activator)